MSIHPDSVAFDFYKYMLHQVETANHRHPNHSLWLAVLSLDLIVSLDSPHSLQCKHV